MISAQSKESKPVLVAKSVHNQRIERHNRALNEQVIGTFKKEFYQLESDGILDISNDTDILCLHFVYIPRINKVIKEFVSAHNNHKISTERNQTPEQLTPEQLFWCNIHLAEHYRDVLPQHVYQPDINELIVSDLPCTVVPETPHTMTTRSLEEIDDLVRSLEDMDGIVSLP